MALICNDAIYQYKVCIINSIKHLEKDRMSILSFQAICYNRRLSIIKTL